MEKKYDLLTFGSVTLDTFITPKKPLEQGENFIVPIGDKVLLQEVFKSCGGSSANASVGFVKLGLKTGTFGFIGDDRGGASIKHILDDEGLDTHFLTISPHSESSMSVILNAHDGRRTVFNYKNPMEDFDPEHLWDAPETRGIYIGHVSENSEDFLFAIPEWKKKTGSLIAWNPGKTQFKKGLSHFASMLSSVDVLILNKEEAQMFAGKDFEELDYDEASEEQVGKNLPVHPPFIPEKIYDMRSLAQSFLEAGIAKVVITDSKRGAQLFDREGHHYRACAPDVQIVSTLGAGDAFSVGVVSAVLYDQPVEKQLLWGSWSAGSVIQQFGAQYGQANLEEMKRLVG